MEYCTRCISKESEYDSLLAELSHSKDRSVRGMFQRLRDGESGALRDRVVEHVQERLDEEPGDHVQVTDNYDRHISNKMLPKDIEECLEDYVQAGDIELAEGEIRITPKGGRKLAGRIAFRFQVAPKKRAGTHRLEQMGSGLDRAPYSKKYELGDAYHFIDMHSTLFSSLERNAQEGNGPMISLKPEDLRIYEKTRETRTCIALVIDESGSMTEDKRNAAIDMCLALARLKQPRDKLKVFVYASEVKEIPYWDIVNVSFPGGTTDMRAALQYARKSLVRETGDKQVYLITDTEPNTENGKYVGFEGAIPGVVREVSRYRQDGITLNIIMLDEKAKSRELASHLAKVNSGMVFFASPDDLGRVVIQDYLYAKRSATQLT